MTLNSEYFPLYNPPSPGNELTKIMTHLDELEVLLPAETAPYLTALRALWDLNWMANRVSVTFIINLMDGAKCCSSLSNPVPCR